MDHPHFFSLGSQQPQIIRQSGSRNDATGSVFPALKGLSLSLLTLDPDGVREPHWHPNANELGYCLEGNGLITIFSPGSDHETFTISPGTLSFVPIGSMHHIENIGNVPLKMAICFDNENAEDLNLSSGIQAMPAHIMADTFRLSSNFFSDIPKESQDAYITTLKETTKPELYEDTNRYKFVLDNVIAQVNTNGGWVKMSNNALMPTLKNISAYKVSLNPGGAREPHWHPNAAELNYLISGTARITLVSPKGHIETYDLKAGDVGFMPKGYLHHIENTGKDNANFIIFFGNTSPSDIGFSGCLGAYSNKVLASLFHLNESYFDKLPKYQNDLFVVGGG